MTIALEQPSAGDLDIPFACFRTQQALNLQSELLIPREAHMDHLLASLREADVEYLARKYWLPVEEVKRAIELTASRSRKEIEEALALARKLRYEGDHT